jgi:hypothetical protein
LFPPWHARPFPLFGRCHATIYQTVMRNNSIQDGVEIGRSKPKLQMRSSEATIESTIDIVPGLATAASRRRRTEWRGTLSASARHGFHFHVAHKVPGQLCRCPRPSRDWAGECTLAPRKARFRVDCRSIPLSTMVSVTSLAFENDFLGCCQRVWTVSTLLCTIKMR